MQISKCDLVEFGLVEFDPSKENMDSIAIIGKRSAGKTYLIIDLLHTRQFMKQKNTLVINPPESVINEYSSISHPPTNMTIHYEYEKAIVDEFINTKEGTIVFDSCMYHNDWMKHKGIVKLFKYGNNLKAKVILSMQFPFRIPSSFKDNMDYIFILKDSYIPTRRRVYELYCLTTIISFEEFNTLMDKIAKEPYTCLVINNKTRNIMIYKAPPLWKRIAARKSSDLDIIREELMQKAWHPSRLKWCLTYDEVEEIFGNELDK
jgi:GTPase SAR1 family protein